MKITYIEHSCFLVETAECYLLFDYYGGDIPLPELDPVKPLLLCNSHAHPDHFSENIFALRNRYPRSFFVLSADVPVPASMQPYTCSLLPHEHCIVQMTDGQAAVSMTAATPSNQATTIKHQHDTCRHQTVNVAIDTLRSNDEGIAFILQLRDICLYHAGDLNNWWWDGDADDQKLADIYHEELEYIRGRHFSAAFIPLDPRLKGWWKGIDDFMHYADADIIFPMHNFGKKGLPKKFLSLDCAQNYISRVVDVEEPLTTWEIE